MKVLHISAECYPAAKAGGLGDVVGALPKYLNQAGVPTDAVIPKYHTKWILGQSFRTVYQGSVRLHDRFFPFAIEQLESDALGFPLFVANIPGKFDRPGVYADPNGGWYGDELERYLCFQQAALQWVASMAERPTLIHCHDHHTGLVPFLMRHGLGFQSLGNIPTVFTIHNGEYHGAFSWSKLHLMPFFDAMASGLLEWGGVINPLACAVKCAWRFTTVSNSYLDELMTFANGMEPLLRQERIKARGILNGIDAQVWDPAADPYLAERFQGDIEHFKIANKRALAHRFNLDDSVPLIAFIGRLVKEKGADLLPDLIHRTLNSGLEVGFVVLGTGEAYLHDAFRRLVYFHQGRFDVALEYNEGLAHQLYAGADFLLMPSLVEPCGLNQMYAMRYGNVPVVRSVGGLRDTVPDVGEPDGGGRGIRFDRFDLDDAHHAVWRATQLFRYGALPNLRQRIMAVDFSWENAARQYIQLYNELQ
jgi:starch synthase